MRVIKSMESLGTLKEVTNYGITPYKIPKSTQDLIPIQKVFKSGIFLVNNRYSKTFQFNDINYNELKDSEKMRKLVDYSAMLNSLDKGGVSVKISIFFKPINMDKFRDEVLLKIDDDLKEVKTTMNSVLVDQLTNSTELLKQSYITITAKKNDISEAEEYFKRIEGSLQSEFSKFKCTINPIDLNERLRLFHDIYRFGSEHRFRYNLEEFKRVGQSFKDAVAPLVYEGKDDYLKYGDRYGQVLFLNTYPNFLDDKMISDIASLNVPMVFTIDFIPIPVAEAIREAEHRNLNAQTKIVKYKRKQQENKNYTDYIPMNFLEDSQGTEELWRDLKERDQNFFITTVTVAHFADSLKELKKNEGDIINKGDSNSCQFLPLTAQQVHGINTALPFGPRYISADRGLITQALAGLCPFSAQEIYNPGGIWYGQNKHTKRMIIGDRRLLINGNGMIVGTSGGGKSFAVKTEIIELSTKYDCDIINLDPAGEYRAVFDMLGGENIKLSPSSNNHINPMEIAHDSDIKSNPVKDKAEFILSLCRIICEKNLDIKSKAIIDRCVRSVYRKNHKSHHNGLSPTLKDLKDELGAIKMPEAQELSLALELFTDGSFDTFSKQTNVRRDARLINYDLSELGKNMLGLGMFILIESIYTRIVENRSNGRDTYIFIDEILPFFEHDYCGEHFENLWKTIRKYRGFITGVTQNVTTLLAYPRASSMLKNSEFVLMLSQAETDANLLKELFSLSDSQVDAIVNHEEGEGLIKFGNTIVTRISKFPKDNEIYKVMTTKPRDFNDETNEERVDSNG